MGGDGLSTATLDMAEVRLWSFLCAPCRYEFKVEDEVEVERRRSPARKVGGSHGSLSLFLCDRDSYDYDYYVAHWERGNNGDEIMRAWMCLLRFNERGGGIFL